MNYLIDTNVISESIKKIPDSKVLEWLQRYDNQSYISAISIAEISRGIALLPQGNRKEQLNLWLEDLCESMREKILSFNTTTAHFWGRLKARCAKKGFNMPSLDAQIAATAQQHQLILVTRNVKDFSYTALKIYNPFKD